MAGSVDVPPREVFECLHERVRDDYDMDGQADLYAPGGVLELPFAPPQACRVESAAGRRSARF